MKLYFIVILSLLVHQNAKVKADCNECNIVHACVSRNSFSVCFEDSPTKQIVTCPKGTVCTSGVHICEPNKEPDCKRSKQKPESKCGVCEDENHVFACIGENVVAFCYGQTRPFYSSLVTCPEGTVCDLNNKEGLCSPREDAWPSCYSNEHNTEHFERPKESEIKGGSCSADFTTSIPIEVTTEVTVPSNKVEGAPKQKEAAETTPPTTTTEVTEETTISTTTEAEITTTEKQTEATTLTTNAPKVETTTIEDSFRTFPPDPQDNYRYYCGTKKLEAIYANIYDPTCETFIYCVQQNGDWFGVEMYCDDEYRYFDPELNQCQPKKPAHCQ